METNKIHDSDALFTSVESYFHRLSKGVKVIYIFITLLIVLVLISLFFIRIPVLINSRGLIRPFNESTMIKSLNSGQVNQIYFTDGQLIMKDDILLSLESRVYKKELNFYTKSHFSLGNEYSDLMNLCSTTPSTLRTEKFRSDYNGFCSSLNKYHSQITNLNKDLSKLKFLLKDSLISTKEYEDKCLMLNQISSDSAVFYNEKYNSWETQKENLRLKLFDIESKMAQLEEKIRQANIRAPISGHIQGLKGLEAGSYVQANQELCKIVPDTTLIAQVFVQSKDISWIYEGIKVRLLIDTYNQQYWGAITAYCQKISRDYTLINDNAVFMVECRITDGNLHYNGKDANITAGLGFTAQFIISENTLWELIKGKMQRLVLP